MRIYVGHAGWEDNKNNSCIRILTETFTENWNDTIFIVSKKDSGQFRLRLRFYILLFQNQTRTKIKLKLESKVQTKLQTKFKLNWIDVTTGKQLVSYDNMFAINSYNCLANFKDLLDYNFQKHISTRPTFIVTRQSKAKVATRVWFVDKPAIRGSDPGWIQIYHWKDDPLYRRLKPDLKGTKFSAAKWRYA